MSKMNIRIISTLFLFVIAAIRFSAQTIIPGGDVSGGWSISDSPFLINGDVQIPEDSLLIIEPGVIVAFDDNYELRVRGKLLAIGTEQDSIYFTKNDTTGFSDPTIPEGGWRGIKFVDIPFDSDTSRFEYCRFEYGKAFGDVWFLNAGGALTVVHFDNIVLSNCTFINNMAAGLEEEVPSGGAVHLAWSDIKIFDNTFKNNRALNGGAIQIHESSPTFRNNIFINNKARDGGAIVISAEGQISFENDEFINNTAENFAGGVLCWPPSITSMENVKFEGNSGRWAGGLGIIDAEISIHNSFFISNRAKDWGGGIASDFGKLTIKNSVFEKDTCAWGSGGLHLWYSNAELSQTKFINNGAQFGGGIHSGYSTINIDSSEFIENYSDYAGAMHLENSSLFIDSCLFTKNNAVNDGGVMQYLIDTLDYTEPLSLEIKNSQFLKNTAFRRAALEITQRNTEASLVSVTIDSCLFAENEIDRGGNILLSNFIQGFIISNSVFSKNKAALRTAGLNLSVSVSGKIERCLFTENSSDNGGSSAAAIGNYADVKFINSTFANNSSQVGAAFTNRLGTKALLLNSILWNNEPANISLVAVNDSTPCDLQIHYSDVQFGADSIITDSVSTINFGDGNLDEDPLFYDPSNNDYNLSSESPCVDAGTDFFVWEDDTIVHRSPESYYGNNLDMGAFEYYPAVELGEDEKVSYNFYLSQNYPNPFNPMTKINFKIGGKSNQFVKTEIKVYDVLGREVAVLLKKNLQPGNYETDFKAGKLSSGIYFYQLSAGEFRQTKKMILLK